MEECEEHVCKYERNFREGCVVIWGNYVTEGRPIVQRDQPFRQTQVLSVLHHVIRYGDQFGSSLGKSAH